MKDKEERIKKEALQAVNIFTFLELWKLEVIDFSLVFLIFFFFLLSDLFVGLFSVLLQSGEGAPLK